MITDLSERFLKVLDYLIKSNLVSDNKDFASKISVSSSMITEISKKRSNVGLTAIQNTVLQFPIDSDWLLTGRGSMLYENPQQSKKSSPLMPSDALTMRLMDKLDEKDTTIKEKDIKIDQLQTELREKSEELAAFKSKKRSEHERGHTHHDIKDLPVSHEGLGL